MKIIEHLDQSWNGIEDIVIYGFGKQGKNYINQLLRDFRVVYIIDNGICENSRFYYQIPILSFEEYNKLDNNYKILICAAGENFKSIKEELTYTGKIEYKDFADVDTFLLEWFWKYKKKIYLGRISTSITEKCSLKCKDCSMYMPYFKNPRNFSYEELCRNIDQLFMLVDSIASLLVVGGEPFLSPFLSQYLEYVASTYNNRIGKVVVVTNATIKPDETVLRIMKIYDIEVRISDYTHAVSYKKKLNEIIDKLKEYEITYQIPNFEEWVDMGKPEDNIIIGETPREIREHMLQCNISCSFLCEEKFYYCCRLWSAEKAFDYKLYEGDYLSLTELVENISDGKEKLMEYCIGDLEQNYGHYCQICRGFDKGIPVKAAEQI